MAYTCVSNVANSSLALCNNYTDNDDANTYDYIMHII